MFWGNFEILQTVFHQMLLKLMFTLCTYQCLDGEGGRGTGKGAAFEHFCRPLSGEFDHKFCPLLWTFEFDSAEDWVHLNLTAQSTGSKTRARRDAILDNPGQRSESV